jgi:hypothetical protein
MISSLIQALLGLDSFLQRPPDSPVCVSYHTTRTPHLIRLGRGVVFPKCLLDRRRRGNLWYYGNTEKESPMPYKPTGRRVGRPEKEDAFKPVSVKLPPDLLERVRKYALIHQQSLSELIRDGLEWRISEGDVGYFRNTENVSTPQSDTGNTVILQEVKRLVQRLSGIVGAAEAPAAQESSEPDYSNTILPKMPKPVRLVDAGMPEDEEVAVSAETKAQPLPDTSYFGNTVIQEKVSAKRPGRPGTMREAILDLLRAHPEGLSAEQIRGFLNPAKPLGDTLQGMRRQAVVRAEGKGRELRYFIAYEPTT